MNMDQISFCLMCQYYVQLTTFGTVWMLPFAM